MSQKSSEGSEYRSSQDSDYFPTNKENETYMRTDNFLDGVARSVYCVKPGILRNLEEFENVNSEKQVLKDDKKACTRCLPVLSILADQFRSLLHEGTSLVNRKASHPRPVNATKQLWRNITEQNKWIRNNIFDSMGNYIYCQHCVRNVLMVSSDRLSRQRDIKRTSIFSSEVEMTKADVEKHNLVSDVIVPDDVSLDEYWEELEHDDFVEVKRSIQFHGLQGKRSNNSKEDLMNEFLEFVDCNSQPNGRSENTAGAHYYFLPVFTRIYMPPPSDKNYENKMEYSIVGAFNERQKSEGKEICSNGSALNWLKQYRPRHAVMPHQKDYCDTCKEYEQQIRALQTEINRKRQSGNCGENELRDTEELKANYKQTLKTHKENAANAYRYFRSCVDACQREYKAIQELSASDANNEQLENLKNNFKCVVTLDYQMTKLLPHWGQTAQPSASYYKLKLAVDICVAITHHDNRSHIIIFDERYGPKCSNHTLSFLTHLLQTRLPDWIKHVQIFMDNAAINKNQYLGGWVTQMVEQTHLKEVRASFMDAGHTKFPPDWVMAKIAKTFFKSDVFSCEDLKRVCKSYGEVISVPNDSFEFIVQDWKDQLSQRYTGLPGVQSLHDIRCLQATDTENCTMEVKERCASGLWKVSPQKVKDDALLDIWPTSETDLGLKEIPIPKLRDLVWMYDRWIDQNRRLECIPMQIAINPTTSVEAHQRQLHKHARR